jgi:hypothetical protein
MLELRKVLYLDLLEELRKYKMASHVREIFGNALK